MPIIKPMLAKAGPLPANQAEYGFEIKWDGIRSICYLEEKQCRLMSRNLKDITSQYPELAALSKAVDSKYRELILDGEIVAFDSAGLPSFSRLQHRMGLSDDRMIAEMMENLPVYYIIFDVLSIDNNLLLAKPYTERRNILASLALDGPYWQTPGYHIGEGESVLTASRKLGLEGIVAKRLNSPYHPGQRTGTWLKIKNHRRQELIIGGWVPGQGNRHGKIGALLTGCYDMIPAEAQARNVSQQLLYTGKAGTGFTQASLLAIAKMLKPLRRETSPFSQELPIKNARFVEPLLVGEFEFTEWTPNHTLRHPSFKGLRNDKDPRQVIRED